MSGHDTSAVAVRELREKVWRYHIIVIVLLVMMVLMGVEAMICHHKLSSPQYVELDDNMSDSDVLREYLKAYAGYYESEGSATSGLLDRLGRGCMDSGCGIVCGYPLGEYKRFHADRLMGYIVPQNVSAEVYVDNGMSYMSGPECVRGAAIIGGA